MPLPVLRVSALALIACACASTPPPATSPADAADPGAGRRADAIVLPAPEHFRGAVDALEHATGVEGERIESAGPEIPLESGRSFAVDANVAERLLAGSHTTFRKAGFYLFRYQRSYGLPGEKDHVGLLATADPEVVIRQIGTAGPRRGVGAEQIIAWLRAMGSEEPFELSEIGTDYLAGTFARAPKDPAAIARRSVEIAPDLVGYRANNIELLAEEIRVNRTLYLIWD
jgi:hypothetical protein